MRSGKSILASLALATLLFFGVTGCTRQDAGQFVQDHVSSAGGAVSVDPQTGAITVSGTVGIKQMEEATAISNAIKSKQMAATVKEFRSACQGSYQPVTRHVCDPIRGTCEERTVMEFVPTKVVEALPQAALTFRGTNGHKIKLREVCRPYTNPCGEKSLISTFEVVPSIWHQFLHMFSSGCHSPPPYVPTPELPEADYTNNVPPASTSVPSSIPPVASQPPATGNDPAPGTDDDAIIAAVLANGEDINPKDISGDRAVVFGNNFPGTDAELHQCVNDAKKNVLNLVRVDGFSPKSIRLFTDRQCTKANYEKWIQWAFAAPKRPAFFNSSHGAEDTDAEGKVVDVLVTDDMVRKGYWDATTEVTFDWWYHQLRQVTSPWMLLNDSCHSGGQTKLGLTSNARRSVRSLEGPPEVQKRVAAAVQRSTAITDIGKLTGTVFAVCLPNELASEGPQGGAGTEAYWQARKHLPAEAKAGDIARECNRLFKLSQESQHFTIVGVNGPLWNGQK